MGPYMRGGSLIIKLKEKAEKFMPTGTFMKAIGKMASTKDLVSNALLRKEFYTKAIGKKERNTEKALRLN